MVISKLHLPVARQQGLTYLGLLLFIAIWAAALGALGQVWSTSIQREREEELLFVGAQFRQAIASYYHVSAGVPGFPRSLDDLLLDSRNPGVLRHLRQIYRDPMTGSKEWGLVRAPDGGIMGVFSLSDKAPLKIRNFDEQFGEFAGAKRYSDWKFVFLEDY